MDGQVEARVRVPATSAWRQGVSGEVVITVRRSSILGAMWWGVRRRIRNDLLLRRWALVWSPEHHPRMQTSPNGHSLIPRLAHT